MKKIKLLLLPFVLLVTFVLSCQKDMDEAFDVPHIQDNLKGSNLRQTYEKRFKNDSLLTALKIEPIWNTSVEFEHAIEVAFKTDGKLSFPSSKKGLKGGGRERLLLLEKLQGGYSIIKVRYKPSEDFKKDLKKINTGNFTKEQFDGIITLEELGSDKMQVWEVHGGKVTGKKKRFKSLSKNKGRAKYACLIEECFAEDTNWYQWSVAEGEWHYTNTNTEYWCEYTYVENCGDEDPNQGEDPYDCSQNPYTPWCAGGGNGTTTFSSYITNNLTNPCFSGVLVNLLNSNAGNNAILQILQNFSESPSGNIIFQNQDLSDPTTDGNYLAGVITLNSDALNNSSKEYIAATIMHEVLHAYLKDKINPMLLGDPQHTFMAQNYVIPMTEALMSIYPNLYYTDARAMAWGGLQRTTVWKIIERLSPQHDALEILNLNALHKNYNHQYGGGLGSHCN